MNRINRVLLLIGCFALSGCAAYQLEPLTATHPASPEAATARPRVASNTLAYTRADMPSPQPIMQAANAKGGHEGHAPATSSGASEKSVMGEGKVVATVPASNQLVVDHGEIKGFMDAMTMGYRVEPGSLLDGLKAGDKVRFTIDVPKKAIVKIEKMK